MDHFKKIKELIEALRKAKLNEWTDKLDNDMFGASTGGELISHVRKTLQDMKINRIDVSGCGSKDINELDDFLESLWNR